MNPETAFIFNSLSFLFHGFLVFLMAAGFCLLEAGMVQTKNATAQCIKMVGVYAVAILLFWLTGYNLMYGGDTGLVGHFGFWREDNSSAITPDGVYIGPGTGDFSSSAHWFFQLAFVGVAAAIVSGAVAERVKLLAFFIFTAILVGLIFPVQGSWIWGGGWLNQWGFIDFAGATVVHSVGGWAALTGVVIIGARYGKYQMGGAVTPFVASNIPIATLGTMFLWFGWFGLNGGAQLAMGSAEDAIAIAQVYVNTTMAFASATVISMFAYAIWQRRLDLPVILNAALGGMVAISASPLAPSTGLAAGIGAIGGLLVVFSRPILDKLKIDDVVGAIPVHLICGIWGALAVVFSYEGERSKLEQLLIQLMGIGAVGAFVVITSTMVWLVLRLTPIGVRVGHEVEYAGLDVYECGVKSYPEFTLIAGSRPGPR